VALTLYVPASTRLHRLHPVTKLAGLVAFVIAAFVVDSPLALVPLVAAVFALIVPAGGVPNVRRLRVMFVLVFVFTIVVWTFFYDRLQPGRPTYDGFLYGLSTAMRLDTFLAAGILFLTITRVEEVAYGLGCIRVPYFGWQLVPYKVGFTLTLSFRLVPVFFDAALAVLQAQRCRGLELARGGLVQRLRRFVPILVPVLIGALRRADRMAMALELRGFNSGRPRTTYLRARPGAADAVAGVLLVATTALYVGLWASGVGRLNRERADTSASSRASPASDADSVPGKNHGSLIAHTRIRGLSACPSPSRDFLRIDEPVAAPPDR
jgi:energy-coupling factor transport system permease protein